MARIYAPKFDSNTNMNLYFQRKGSQTSQSSFGFAGSNISVSEPWPAGFKISMYAPNGKFHFDGSIYGSNGVQICNVVGGQSVSVFKFLEIRTDNSVGAVAAIAESAGHFATYEAPYGDIGVGSYIAGTVAGHFEYLEFDFMTIQNGIVQRYFRHRYGSHGGHLTFNIPFQAQGN